MNPPTEWAMEITFLLHLGSKPDISQDLADKLIALGRQVTDSLIPAQNSYDAVIRTRLIEIPCPDLN